MLSLLSSNQISNSNNKKIVSSGKNDKGENSSTESEGDSESNSEEEGEENQEEDQKKNLEEEEENAEEEKGNDKNKDLSKGSEELEHPKKKVESPKEKNIGSKDSKSRGKKESTKGVGKNIDRMSLESEEVEDEIEELLKLEQRGKDRAASKEALKSKDKDIPAKPERKANTSETKKSKDKEEKEAEERKNIDLDETTDGHIEEEIYYYDEPNAQERQASLGVFFLTKKMTKFDTEKIRWVRKHKDVAKFKSIYTAFPSKDPYSRLDDNIVAIVEKINASAIPSEVFPLADELLHYFRNKLNFKPLSVYDGIIPMLLVLPLFNFPHMNLEVCSMLMNQAPFAGIYKILNPLMVYIYTFLGETISQKLSVVIVRSFMNKFIGVHMSLISFDLKDDKGNSIKNPLDFALNLYNEVAKANKFESLAIKAK